ncbi:MAG: 50S ribosomal protein L22 [Chthoniobacterales bacterium]|nr:50S ribosomal protein L22 [Chthoniobacterales bacterium]
MQVKSIYRYAKISAFKAREVTREIQGMPAMDALLQLKFIPKKAAPLIYKTLKSAIANAEQNNNLRPEVLVIKEAVIGEATTLKRITPKARGSAGPIRKRTSHIRIVLTDEVPIVRRSDRAQATKKRAKNNKKEPAHLKKESPVPSAETQPELTSEATA